MAKKPVEEPPIVYRVDGPWGPILICFAVIGDVVAMTLTLAAFVLSLAAAATIWIPVAGQAFNAAGWVVGLTGSLFSLIFSGILMFGFWALRVHNLTRKIARLGIRLLMKMIPILGMFAVFLTSNTMLTISMIKISRAEDRFKWFKLAEQLLAVKVALSNKELNAKAWQKLSDVERATLRGSGFDIDNIESSAFGKELLEEAAKEKIGARDLLPHLRKAKTAGDVEKGLAAVGGKGWKQDILTPKGGVQGGMGSVDGISRSKTRDSRLLGTTDELDMEKLLKAQALIDAQNKENNFQQFYSGLSPSEKQRFDKATDEEKEEMYKEFGLKRDSYPGAEEDKPKVDGVRKLATAGLNAIDMENAEAVVNAAAMAEADTIMKYAAALKDEDYIEALKEAESRQLDKGGALPAPTSSGTTLTHSIGDKTDAEHIEEAKLRIFKQAMRGANLDALIKAENVQPEAFADELETEIIDAENVAKRRARALDALDSGEVDSLDLGDEVEGDIVRGDEIDADSIIKALRDKRLSNKQSRSLMRLKSDEFTRILNSMRIDERIRARQIRYGQWFEKKAGELQRAKDREIDRFDIGEDGTTGDTPRISRGSVQGVTIAGDEPRGDRVGAGRAADTDFIDAEKRDFIQNKSQAYIETQARGALGLTGTKSFEEYRGMLNDPTLSANIRQTLREARRAQALTEMGALEGQIRDAGDEWLRDALSGDKLSNEEKREVLVRVKHSRTERMENPATPESERKQLQKMLDGLEDEFKGYLSAQGLEETQ